MGNKNKILLDTFGNKYEDFIKFLNSLSKDIIRIFKEQYGENLDSYNENSKLTSKEKNIITTTKTRYKKLHIFNDDIEKDSTKISHFKDQVLRVYGTSLEEIFLGNMETITYLLNNEFKKEIDKKTTKEMVETLKGILKKIKINRDKFSENQPLYGELIKYGFNSDKLNTYVFNRLSAQSQLFIKLKYTSSLNSLNNINMENQRILNNIILPLLFSRLKNAYKKFEERHLQNMLGKNYENFLVYLKTLSIIIQTIFQELFGRKYDTYIFDNHLSKEKLDKIYLVINEYLEQIKNKSNTKLITVIEPDISEENSDQIIAKDTENNINPSYDAIIQESEKHNSAMGNYDCTEFYQTKNEKNGKSKGIGINSSFTLHLIDKMGNESYRDYTILDMKTFDEPSDYEKILVYHPNARRMLGKSEGDKFLFIKGEVKYEATILKIYDQSERYSRSISMETISKYANSEYLPEDIINQYRNNSYE